MNPNAFAARTKRYKLSNGITLFVLENHANPTVSISGSMRGGEFFSPAGKDGLAGITASMLNKGSRRRSKLEIAESLESAGARVSVSANTFTVSIGGLSLSRDLPLIVSTLAEELCEPAFPADELDKLKQRVIANIREDQDETRSRAYERLTQIVFAEENPFHIYPADRTIREIESITADDLQAFYQTYYGAGSTILSVVGDVVPDEVRALVETSFGDWRGATPPPIELPETPLQAGTHREVVAMKDKANCDVLIGHASRLRRTHPDYLQAIVANNALGESTLSSRLGLKVRDEMGLTYGINSNFSKTGLGDGPFVIGVTVAPQNIDLALETTLDIVNDYIASGIRQEELDDEKSSLIGSFKLGLATNSGIAGQITGSEVFNLGVNYLDEYPAMVSAITKKQVDDAIRKYLHPECATTVIAGTL
jgi:zinc protease